ncbi:hypothetical protein VNO80_09642 [Phaseolus coccineus]|uniref:Uncharacterized protein n=1 Tax=Phaseolus coccineus TaxID=3886 RepID=A0AAN9NBW4_PHACN
MSGVRLPIIITFWSKNRSVAGVGTKRHREAQLWLQINVITSNSDPNCILSSVVASCYCVCDPRNPPTKPHDGVFCLFHSSGGTRFP